MIDLDFAVEGAEVARQSATPLLLLKLRIDTVTPGVPVENVMLQAQVRIMATHRHYGQGERERLVELFGKPAEWDRTLRDLLWAQTSASVPAFEEACTIDLPVPCSYDFDVAATKYFYGVEEGEIPLSLLFSGTVFFRNAEGDLQIGQIPHTKEARYRLPVPIWRSMMDHHYGDGAWLRVSHDVFEELYRCKRRMGFTSWDQALRFLLEARSAEAGA